jgi:hypothetical protein
MILLLMFSFKLNLLSTVLNVMYSAVIMIIMLMDLINLSSSNGRGRLLKEQSITTVRLTITVFSSSSYAQFLYTYVPETPPHWETGLIPYFG